MTSATFIISFAFTLLLLSSCSSTGTATSLAYLNNEELILPGDLPSEFVGGQVSHTLPDVIGKVPAATQIIHQEVTEGRLASDGVAVLIYEETSDVEDAFHKIADSLEKEEPLQVLSDVGEKAIYFEKFTNGYLSSYTTKIVYTRCQAVVFISLFSPKAKAEVVTAYAQQLDRRLESMVCP